MISREGRCGTRVWHHQRVEAEFSFLSYIVTLDPIWVPLDPVFFCFLKRKKGKEDCLYRKIKTNGSYNRWNFKNFPKRVFETPFEVWYLPWLWSKFECLMLLVYVKIETKLKSSFIHCNLGHFNESPILLSSLSNH